MAFPIDATTPRPSRERDLAVVLGATAILALVVVCGVLGVDRADEVADEGALPSWSEIAESETAHEAIEALRTRARRRFGLRNWLVRAHAHLTVFGLRTSANPDVVLGEEGWLYLADDEAMDTHRNLRPFSDLEVRGLAHRLEEQKRWFDALGITFLVAIAPDKSTIAPEGLPAALRDEVGTRSRYDQIAEAAAASPTLRSAFLDLREPLTKAHRESGTYHPTDTHWNQTGAWVAYREILERLRARVPRLRPPHGRDAFEIREEEFGEGDLARMLGVGGALLERTPIWSPRFRPRAAELATLAPLRQLDDDPKVLVAVSQDSRAPRALVFRDSFGEALIPLLSEHFSYAQYVWHDSFEYRERAAQVLADLRPHVVLAVLAERRLMAVAADPSAVRRAQEAAAGTPSAPGGSGGGSGSPKKKSTR